jgi:hypothetical protein
VGRYGVFTRIAMLVFGAIWLAAGACWLAALVRRVVTSPYSVDQLGEDEAWFWLASFLAVGGFMMVKTSIMPDRPKSFEDEVADAEPKLDLWDD